MLLNILIALSLIFILLTLSAQYNRINLLQKGYEALTSDNKVYALQLVSILIALRRLEDVDKTPQAKVSSQLEQAIQNVRDLTDILSDMDKRDAGLSTATGDK